MSEPITEDWLRDVGFKFDTPFKPDAKHWTLWMGGAVSDRTSYSSEDLGIELAHGGERCDWWFCWLRADYAGRYTRIIHVRHMRTREELIALISALTGFPFNPLNSMYGSYHKPEATMRLRTEYEKRLEVSAAIEWGHRAMRETGQDQDGRDKVRP